MRNAIVLVGLIGSVALYGACSASAGGGSLFTGAGGGQSTGAGAGTTGAGTGQGGDDDIGFDAGFGGAGSTGSGSTCNSGPNDDADHDGWTVAAGDCNDCDPNVNPGAIEVPTGPAGDGGMAMPADEDCDGQVDNVDPPCDTNLMLADIDPWHGANAIDLCKKATPMDKKWGVLDAKYVRANGTTYPTPGVQVGIEPQFGPNVHPQAGSRMLVVSSGAARALNDPGACGSLSCYYNSGGVPPPGFPQDVPNCSGSPDINDDVGLEVKVRAPTNATGYAFDFFFYSFEYPEWVCTSFNDQFIALVNPPPMGSINGNISFDSKSNPVSVNIAFFGVCAGCPLGTAQLQGTGFDVWNDAGGTGWLKTQAPVAGGQEFSIRFAIWDTGDQAWDSTTLIDNFRWIANGGTVTIGTDPIPIPK